MPAAALPILAVLLAASWGALGGALVSAVPAVAQAETPATPLRSLAALKADGPEFYLHPLEQGWIWQAVESEPPHHVMTFTPEDQSQRGWTDALLLGIRRGDRRPPQDLLAWAERQLATQCRDLRRSGLEQGETADGWAEAWRLFSCPSRRVADGSAGQVGGGQVGGGQVGGGVGEIRLLRAVQGERAGYLIARVWRRPAFAADSPIGQQEIQLARSLLTAGDPCLRDSLRSTCPFYSSMGLGALDDAKPYGVFDVR